MPLLFHDTLIFSKPRSRGNLGWCVANVYDHDGKIIGVLSEKYNGEGDYDRGESAEYPYTLTNGIESACTKLFEALCDKFGDVWALRNRPDELIHYTPARPAQPWRMWSDAEYARIELDWRDWRYAERPGVHPWQSISKEEFEALIGLSAEQITL
jgi:hypothetical protein